jgi:hypothetical protein
MIFKLIVKHKAGDRTWEEEYNKNVDDPYKWGKEIIEYFNSTLRPREKPRELVDVIVINDKPTAHDWVKRTDSMSVRCRGGIADIYYCSRCGITAKRYGLEGTIVRDYKYRKKAFKRCDTALEERGSD